MCFGSKDNTAHHLRRWAKGGSSVLGARGPMLEVVADASFLTAPVSCEVSNAVGSANRSTALDVRCEQGRGRGCGQSGVREMGLGLR